MSESKWELENWKAEKRAFEAEADRRAALAKTRRKHLFASVASIEDDPAHNVASAAEPLERQW